MLKNIFKIFAIFIVGIIGGIFADQILWPYFIERPLFLQYQTEKPPVYITERKEIIVQENVALKNAIEKVEKAIVGVRSEGQKGEIREGSGLIVTSDGLLVTLAEIVPQGEKFSFFVEGEPVPYQVLKRDPKENLALIKIEKTNLPTVSFAELGKLSLGERVFLVGIVFGKEKSKKVVNEGIVRSFGEEIIETTILEGKSLAGSSLFNIEGQCLGLNFVDQGRVFTIPITKIKKFAGL